MYKKIYPVVLASLLLVGCSSTGGTNTTVVSLETTAGTVKVAAEDVNGETIVVEYDASVVPESSEAAAAESEAAATLPASSEAESESAAETMIASSEAAESSSAAIPSSSAEETTIAIDGFTATGTIRCISDGARVRETPRGTILGNLSYGDIVQTDGVTENGWIHIWSESFGIGYVYQDFVTSVQ